MSVSQFLAINGRYVKSDSWKIIENKSNHIHIDLVRDKEIWVLRQIRFSFSPRSRCLGAIQNVIFLITMIVNHLYFKYKILNRFQVIIKNRKLFKWSRLKVNKKLPNNKELRFKDFRYTNQIKFRLKLFNVHG